MKSQLSTRCAVAIVVAASWLSGCADNGGADVAVGLLPGPPLANQPVQPINPLPVPPSSFNDSSTIQAQITDVQTANGLQLSFVVADQDNVAIDDLTLPSVRFVVAKLVPGENGDSDYWQSYINEEEEVEELEEDRIGPGDVDTIQATYERNGVFENLGNGQYRYTFATDITNVSSPLEVSYEPSLTHRVAIQFSGVFANPVYTWLPATGATEGIASRDIVDTKSCNRCHDPLAIHGGGRREVKYCVACHNPGSTDANSGNTVDMKVMIHKIHRGVNLPSVVGGQPYQIWGFRDSLHDYSHLALPMDIRNCTTCHAGSLTGDGGVDGDASLVETNQGDNWAMQPSMQACGSCHDDLDFSAHMGGQTNNNDCASCHAGSGDPERVIDAHKIPEVEAGKAFAFNILGVTATNPGDLPQVSFSVSNPLDDNSLYDLFAVAGPWSSTGDGASRLAVTLAWDTQDYNNTGNGSSSGASSVSIDALANASIDGGGIYSVTSPIALPDGLLAPNIAVSGSAAATMEGHPAVTIDGELERIPVTNTVSYFSVDEADGIAVPRREAVAIENCLNCHKQLSLHGSNRTDSVEVCVTCHNPRNTDRSVREVAVTMPTDGKVEESLDFKTMVHGIHAAGMRENALQVVGFRGFNTHVFDEEHVHFPGDLANCQACHTEDGYKLPLPANVLATTVDTGADRQDPTDDTVITRVSATCSSCHDGSEAIAHMKSQGGSFSTTQALIDNGTVVESCSVCHGEGRDYDVATVHNVHAIQ